MASGQPPPVVHIRPKLDYAPPEAGLSRYWRVCGHVTLYGLAIAVVSWQSLLIVNGLDVFRLRAPALGWWEWLLLLLARTHWLPLLITLCLPLAFMAFWRLSAGRLARAWAVVYLASALVAAAAWVAANIAVVRIGTFVTYETAGTFSMSVYGLEDLTPVLLACVVLLVPAWLMAVGWLVGRASSGRHG